jgi:chorismate lyase / 3-hydroxybenzoate synthase
LPEALNNSSIATIVRPPLLQVRIGSDLLPVGLPILSGGPEEGIFSDAILQGETAGIMLATQGDWLVGAALGEAGEEPEAAAGRLYRGLLQAARGYTLCRIWNYVPQINEPNALGLENYRAFCRGRSLAFEQELGEGFAQGLPAASGVGTGAEVLAVVFAASRLTPLHFENPLQLAAYDYPPEHGPRAPSFARATRVGADVFISGTAAVRGHQSVAPGSTAAQLDCTLENLVAISRACGLGDDLGAGRARARFWKIYLRHTLDYAGVAQRLAEWLRPDDHVHYLLSDICRAELNVEIEVSVLGLRDV